MITEPISSALAFKYHKPGASIRTIQKEDGSFEIFEWSHPDNIHQPTESEILAAISEYKAYLQSEKENKKNRKKAIMQKLGLTKQDLKALLDLIQDGTDE